MTIYLIFNLAWQHWQGYINHIYGAFRLTGWPLGDDNNSLRWGHNGHDSVSNNQPNDCLLNRLFRRKSKKTPKLRVTGLCAVNSPGTGEFPAEMASNAENVSIWWRHHVSKLDFQFIVWIDALFTSCKNVVWQMPSCMLPLKIALISLTHWGRDKMAAIFQTTFSNGFSWMKMYEFWLTFHWSLFLRIKSTIFRHWFR